MEFRPCLSAPSPARRPHPRSGGQGDHRSRQGLRSVRDAEKIQDYVKKQTAPYKYPRVVEFVAELPKTISGKIRRAQIRKEID